MMNATNMYYSNIFSNFNIEWDTYEDFKKKDDTNYPKINDKDNNHN